MNESKAVFLLYKSLTVEAFRACTRNWVGALATPALFLVLMFAGWLVSPLGFAGGLILSVVSAGCYGAYLYLIEQVLHPRGRLAFSDLKRGFSLYVWDVLSVLFILWIAGMAFSMLTRAMVSPLLSILVTLVAVILLNAVPELIYLGRSRSVELLQQSALFVQEHWLEWFAPNLVIVGLLTLLLEFGLHPQGAFGNLSPAYLLQLFGYLAPSVLATAVSVGALKLLTTAEPLSVLLCIAMLFGTYYWMVFRGLLFQALTSGRVRRIQRGFDRRG